MGICWDACGSGFRGVSFSAMVFHVETSLRIAYGLEEQHC